MSKQIETPGAKRIQQPDQEKQAHHDLSEAMKASIRITDLKTGDVVIARVPPDTMPAASVRGVMIYWEQYFKRIGKQPPLLLVFTSDVAFDVLTPDELQNWVEGRMDNPEVPLEDKDEKA